MNTIKNWYDLIETIRTLIVSSKDVKKGMEIYGKINHNHTDSDKVIYMDVSQMGHLLAYWDWNLATFKDEPLYLSDAAVYLLNRWCDRNKNILPQKSTRRKWYKES